jgi:hypothetical protein
VAVVVQPDSVQLTWKDRAQNEEDYVVERKSPVPTEGPPWQVIATLGPNAQGYTDSGLTPAFYSYRVKARNEGGSAYSNVVTTPGPNPPTILQAIVWASPLEVSLGWTQNSNNETAFLVERRLGAGSFSVVAQLPPDTTSWTDDDPNLQLNQLYTYRVRAYWEWGYSSYSNEALANTSALPPAAPTNVEASLASTGRALVTWNDISNNENGYFVGCKPTSSGIWPAPDWLQAGTTWHLPIVNPALNESKDWHCSVTAWNAFGTAEVVSDGFRVWSLDDANRLQVNVAVSGGGTGGTVKDELTQGSQYVRGGLINCLGDCEEWYPGRPPGPEDLGIVLLRAYKEPGYIISWSGCTQSNSDWCTVEMGSDKTVTVTFSK